MSEREREGEGVCVFFFFFLGGGGGGGAYIEKANYLIDIKRSPWWTELAKILNQSIGREKMR